MKRIRKKPLLFEYFPNLENNISWLNLAPLQTPVEQLFKIQEKLKTNSLWIKRDDLSSPLYGGNKVRKFEFIHAEILAKKCNYALTFGGIGSNHCVANAIFCNELKIKPIACLIDQPITSYVRNNLLLDLYFKNKIIYSHKRSSIKFKALWQLIRKKKIYVILPGGSSPIGTLGFVNAGLELKSQIDNGEMPEPDIIFVACGSMGTAAGLSLGLEFAGSKTYIKAVKITDSKGRNIEDLTNLAFKTWKLMKNCDSNIPTIKLNNISIDDNHIGGKYGKPTKEGFEAIHLMKDNYNIKFEPTYTGKAFAALCSFVKNNRKSSLNKTILFWNTYNGRDFTDILSKVDYHDLPEKLHWIFEKELPDYNTEQER